MPYSSSRYGIHSPRHPKKKRVTKEVPHIRGFPSFHGMKSNYLADLVDGRVRLSKEGREHIARAKGEIQSEARVLQQRIELDHGRHYSNPTLEERAERELASALSDSRRSLIERWKQKESERARRKVLMDFFSKKRGNKKYINWLFKKTIAFQLPDHKKVRILAHGFENIYHSEPKVQGRGLVAVFVDGQHLLFYCSSGENSRMPGRWLPIKGVDSLNYDGKLKLGWLQKLAGHPNKFPAWVELVSERIESAVKRGKINLLREPAPEKVKQFLDAVSFYPLIVKRGEKFDEWALPN